MTTTTAPEPTTTPDTPEAKDTILGILFLRDVPFWTSSTLRYWLRRLVALVYLYVGVLLVLLWLENWLLYPGSWIDKGWEAAPADLNAEDFFLELENGTKIIARWCPPKDWKPEDGAILYSHGNGGNLSNRSGYARLWRKHFERQAILLYDYPGYGKSGGSPSEAGCYAAGEACYTWLREEKGVPAKEIILLGESLGGGITYELATRHEHRAVVTMSTFTSFPDMAQLRFPWLPARWLVSHQYNNLDKIGKLPGPVVIAHGTVDHVIPFQHGERLKEAAPENSLFIPLEGWPHIHPESPGFFEKARQFLDEARQPAK
jgi:pimeloyl-ACP methyl ester carboxylesterase